MFILDEGHHLWELQPNFVFNSASSTECSNTQIGFNVSWSWNYCPWFLEWLSWLPVNDMYLAGVYSSVCLVFLCYIYVRQPDTRRQFWYSESSPQDSHSYFAGNSPAKWAYLNASLYFLSHHFQFSSPQRVFYLHLVATLEFLTHLLTIGDTSDPSTGIYLHPPSMAAHSLRASSPPRCTRSFRYIISDLLQY